MLENKILKFGNNIAPLTQSSLVNNKKMKLKLLSATILMLFAFEQLSGKNQVKLVNDFLKDLKRNINPSLYWYTGTELDPIQSLVNAFSPLTGKGKEVSVISSISEGLTNDQVKHILGTQAYLWAEYMPTTYQVEYMSYPRALAFAKVAWSKKEDRNFDDFYRRLQAQYRLLQRENINYYRASAFLMVIAQPDYEKKHDVISFQSEQYRPEIRFTLDKSVPSTTSMLDGKPFYTSGKTEIKATGFSNGEMSGVETNYIADYHLAICKKVIYNQLWSDSYPAQKEQTLTNGVKGSLTYYDKQWLGFLNDFDAIVDMDSIQSISSVAVRFMYQPGQGVYLPSYVEVQFSDDGKTYSSYQKLTHDVRPDNPALIFKTFTFDCKLTQARYIRIIAPNVMKGFMFVDEIIVY
jgi:hexosaminidase